MSLYSYTNRFLSDVYIATDKIRITGNKIKLFALDKQTIGLSNNPPAEWLKSCLFMKEVDVLEEEDDYHIFLPPNVVKFYGPKQFEFREEIQPDKILLTIH